MVEIGSPVRLQDGDGRVPGRVQPPICMYPVQLDICVPLLSQWRKVLSAEHVHMTGKGCVLPACWACAQRKEPCKGSTSPNRSIEYICMCVLRKVLCNEVVWIEAAQAAELWAGRCRGGKSKFTVGAEVRAGEVVD